MGFLRIKNLTKVYPGKAHPALHGVEFEMKAGEILSLLGPSGSGKTTLLRLLAGFDRPTEGGIWLEGRELANGHFRVPPERREVGMVFQDFALFPHLSVAENIAFGMNGVSRRERQKRVEECLDMVELKPFADESPLRLSGGQQQRVALARALAPKPRILLLDEPFSNMDAKLRERLSAALMDLLRSLGVTAIFVTHDTADALAFAHRVGVLIDGRLLQIDTPDVICRSPNSRAVAQMIGKMNLIPAERRDQGLATCFGTFYPEAHRLREIQEDIRNPLWLGLRPQSFIPWAAGVFQGAVMKTYCTPLGREALVHYHGTDSPAPLPLIIPVQRNTDIGEQLNFNVQLDEATILLS